jgi:hypothetical protein
MRSTGVRAGAMDVIPETPLSHEELNRAVVRLAALPLRKGLQRPGPASPSEASR